MTFQLVKSIKEKRVIATGFGSNPTNHQHESSRSECNFVDPISGYRNSYAVRPKTSVMMARGRYYKNAVLAVVLALAISFATVVQAGNNNQMHLTYNPKQLSHTRHTGAPCEGDGVNASDCSPDESEGSYNVLGMVNNRSQYLRDVVERLWRPAAAVQEEEEREGEVPMPSAASSTTRSLRSRFVVTHTHKSPNCPTSFDSPPPPPATPQPSFGPLPRWLGTRRQ